MKLTIIGASGHGKVAADIAKLCGYDELEFLDDNLSVRICADIPVTGTSADAGRKENALFVAVGNPAIRQRLMEAGRGKYFSTLVHPKAVIAENSQIGEGSVVMAGAVINPCTVIGRGAIINTCSSVDHDCIIHDYVHVAVGAHVCGNVEIGNGTWIGAGSTIINNVRICAGCIIGAGAVVIEDIDEPGVYLGVPARKKRPSQLMIDSNLIV